MADNPIKAGENSIPIICRPTLPTDREQVLELSSHIWDGQDYIAHVWDAWLAEPLLRLNFGMIDLSWCWGRPRREHLEAEAREGQAWWWHGRRNRRGLLTMWKDYDIFMFPASIGGYVHCYFVKSGTDSERFNKECRPT